MALRFGPSIVAKMFAAAAVDEEARRNLAKAIEATDYRMSGAVVLDAPYERVAADLAAQMGGDLPEARRIIIAQVLAEEERKVLAQRPAPAQQAAAAKRARPINFAAAKRRRLLR